MPEKSGNKAFLKWVKFGLKSILSSFSSSQKCFISRLFRHFLFIQTLHRWDRTSVCLSPAVLSRIIAFFQVFNFPTFRYYQVLLQLILLHLSSSKAFFVAPSDGLKFTLIKDPFLVYLKDF